MIPKGKGVFLWNIWNFLDGKPETLVARAKNLGLDWVAVKIVDGTLNHGLRPVVWPVIWVDDILMPFILGCQDLGIKVIGWGYVYGYNPTGEAVRAISRINETGVDGYMINAEVEYEKPGMGAAATTYLKKLRGEIPETCKVGLSSFRFPTSAHGTFPWMEFMARCDYMAPQVYWIDAHNPVDQLARCKREYLDLYKKFGMAARPIIPAGAMFRHGSWQPTSQEVRDFADAVISEYQAVHYWEWRLAEKYGYEEILGEQHWSDQPTPDPGPDDSYTLERAREEIAGLDARVSDLEGIIG